MSVPVTSLRLYTGAHAFLYLSQPVQFRSLQDQGLGSLSFQFGLLHFTMDLSKIEFGAEMKKECFHFEEGYIFVNHAAYGEVPVLMRDKQKQ